MPPGGILIRVEKGRKGSPLACGRLGETRCGYTRYQTSAGLVSATLCVLWVILPLTPACLYMLITSATCRRVAR